MDGDACDMDPDECDGDLVCTAEMHEDPPASCVSDGTADGDESDCPNLFDGVDAASCPTDYGCTYTAGTMIEEFFCRQVTVAHGTLALARSPPTWLRTRFCAGGIAAACDMEGRGGEVFVCGGGPRVLHGPGLSRPRETLPLKMPARAVQVN
jgi:hypothetical protein